MLKTPYTKTIICWMLNHYFLVAKLWNFVHLILFDWIPNTFTFYHSQLLSSSQCSRLRGILIDFVSTYNIFGLDAWILARIKWSMIKNQVRFHEKLVWKQVEKQRSVLL